MNNNSTQKEIRNFVSKISNFFTILLRLPAHLRIAGNFRMVPCYTSARAKAVSKSIITSFFSFRNYHNGFVIPGYFELLPVAGNSSSSGIFNFMSSQKPPLRVKPIVINQY